MSHGAAKSKQIGRDAIALAAKLRRPAADVAEGWNGFALLHNAAGRVGGLDIGFVPHDGGVCSADQIGLPARASSTCCSCSAPTSTTRPAMGKAFVVYVGTHGDAGAHRADVILPAAAYTEKSGTYVNTEGRVQLAERAVFPPGEAKEDWAIFRALSAVLGQPLPFNSLSQLRAAIYAEFPHLARLDQIAPSSIDDVKKLAGACDQDQDGDLGRLADRRLLPHQPHRALVRDDGRMLSAAGSASSRRRSKTRWISSFQPLDYLLGIPILGWGTQVGFVYKALLLLVALLIFTAYILLADRKIWAAVQVRRGPNVVGPFGLLQSFADLLKFVFKEPVIPAGSDKGVFLLAPLVTSILALSA